MVGVHFLVQKVSEDSHEGPDVFHAEAATVRSPERKCAPLPENRSIVGCR